MTIIEAPEKFRKQKLWVVTYDLPSSKSFQAERRKFYRHLQKWLREHPETGTVWMAMSTLITQDRELAEFLLEEIDRVGSAKSKASLYEAYLVKMVGVPKQFTLPTMPQLQWMASPAE